MGGDTITFLFLALLLFSSTIQRTSAATPKDQAIIDVALALNAAGATGSTISALSQKSGNSQSDAGILRDCGVQIGVAIDGLKRSLDSLEGNGNVGDVKGWASEALHAENACSGEANQLSGGLKSSVADMVSNAQQLTLQAVNSVNKL